MIFDVFSGCSLFFVLCWWNQRNGSNRTNAANGVSGERDRPGSSCGCPNGKLFCFIGSPMPKRICMSSKKFQEKISWRIGAAASIRRALRLCAFSRPLFCHRFSPKDDGAFFMKEAFSASKVTPLPLRLHKQLARGIGILKDQPLALHLSPSKGTSPESLAGDEGSSAFSSNVFRPGGMFFSVDIHKNGPCRYGLGSRALIQKTEIRNICPTARGFRQRPALEDRGRLPGESDAAGNRPRVWSSRRNACSRRGCGRPDGMRIGLGESARNTL